METWSLVGGQRLCRGRKVGAGGRGRYLEADADAAEEGESPGGQQGRHPAGAAGKSAEGHCQAWSMFS